MIELLTLTVWEALSHEGSHPRVEAPVQSWAFDRHTPGAAPQYATVRDALKDGWIPVAEPFILEVVDPDAEIHPEAPYQEWGLLRRWRFYRKVESPAPTPDLPPDGTYFVIHYRDTPEGSKPIVESFQGKEVLWDALLQYDRQAGGWSETFLLVPVKPSREQIGEARHRSMQRRAKEGG